MAFYVEQIKKIRLSDYSDKTQDVIKFIKAKFGNKAVTALDGEGFFIVLDEYKDDIVGNGYGIGEYEIYSSYIKCLKRYSNITKTRLADQVIKTYHTNRNFTFEIINKLIGLNYFYIEKHGNREFLIITDEAMSTLIDREDEKV